MSDAESRIDYSGGVKVEPRSAFGEWMTAELDPRALIHFPYNLNTDIVTTSTAGSGAVTHSGQFALINSGAATSSSGTLQSNRVLEYHPGIGGLCRFTCVYGTGTAGNTQLAGLGSTTDGFFFGYNGTSFGILHRAGSSDTWTAQASWNVDTLDGNGPSGMTLDTSKGNVFQIQYQWLGFGAIRFYIENQTTGTLALVHRVDYTNQNTDVSVDNPTFPFYAISDNDTNNTDIQMKVPSIGLFVEGKPNGVGATRNAISNTKSITTETNVLTIRNKSTYQSVTNQIRVSPDFVTLAADGTKNVTVNVYRNTTLGGTPSYADISTNTSVVDYDTAGTTVSGGTLLISFAVDKVGSLSQLMGDLDIVLHPGDTLTWSAVSANSNDVTVALSWKERFT